MRQLPRASRTRRRCVLAVVLLCTACSSGTTAGSSTSATSTSAISTTTTTVATTTTVPATTVPTTATTVPVTTASPATTSTIRGNVPDPVTVINASPGGGTGEVMVDWNAVPGATGYRVDRAITAAGPWETVAVFSIITGHATVVADVTNLWSTGYMYVPATGAGSLPDRSPSFEYVEYPVTTTHCFRVFAVNAAGRSTAPVVVCSGPPS